MSEFQETLLDTTGNGAKNLTEAFGCPLEELHIVNEDGKDLSGHVREKVLANLLSEDAGIAQTPESKVALGEVMKKTKSLFRRFFFSGTMG